MVPKEYDFGTIIDYKTPYPPRQISRITGCPKNKPKFVMMADETLWNKYWTEKSSKMGFEYISSELKFDKDFKLSPSPDEIAKSQESLITLISFYSDAARKYNEEIAEPFFNSRKSLLSEVLK